jgi:CspA family cold shock protein
LFCVSLRNGFTCFGIAEQFQRVVAFSEIPVEPGRRKWFNVNCAVRSLGWPRNVCEEAVKMALGTVKWFNDAKGYGFISRADDGKDVFVHYSSITGEGFRTLNQGQEVEYEEQQGPKGLFAAKVMKASGSAS